jgi:hypothetical protein
MGCNDDDDDDDNNSVHNSLKERLNRLLSNNKISTNTRRTHVTHYIHIHMHECVERTEEQEIKAIQFGSAKYQPEVKIRKLQYLCIGLIVTNTIGGET